MMIVNRSAASKAAELAILKYDGVMKINTHAHATRKKYISDIAGQDMMYLRKEAEAIEYMKLTGLADESGSVAPSLDKFPFLREDSMALGLTGVELSRIILFKADQWAILGPKMEGLRVGANNNVGRATSAVDIDFAVNDFLYIMGDF